MGWGNGSRGRTVDVLNAEPMLISSTSVCDLGGIATYDSDLHSILLVAPPKD